MPRQYSTLLISSQTIAKLISILFIAFDSRDINKSVNDFIDKFRSFDFKLRTVGSFGGNAD